MDGHTFLKALATILCVAAATTVLFAKLRLPVVLGYVLAGMMVGPHIPIPLIAEPAVATTLAELGVTLLMFSLGLEFSLRKLVRIGKAAGLIMIIEVSTMLGLGYALGRLLGWTPLESVFAGAIASISSTMIIAKSFSEQHMERGHVSLVFGVLVFEDLMAILLLAALTTVSTGQLSFAAIAMTAARLGAFLLGLLCIGLLTIPRLVRAVARLESAETLLVLCVGLCFAVALLAHALGYSVALGAFVCGSVVAESGEGKRIEPLLHPLRDLFGAVFFVSVGMSIDPGILSRYWKEVLALSALVVGGKITGVTLGALLTGNSLRASVQAAMALAQIGEFSFILAGLGVAQGATREFLYPLAVGVSALTALLTPALMRASLPVATYLDRRLPRRLQNFLALYAAWVERLGAQRGSGRSVLRRLVRLVLLDDLCLGGLYIGAALSATRVQSMLGRWSWLPPRAAAAAVAVAAALLSIPFWVGHLRTSRRLAQELAASVIPIPPAGQADLGAVPRRTLALLLHLLVLLCAGAPLVVVTAPFIPPLVWGVGVIAWVALLAAGALAFWRSAENLLGHVRAGAQAVVELLAAQSHSQVHDSMHDQPAPAPLPDSMATFLAGLGQWASYRLEPADPAVGRSLAQLNLRGHTGATVLAIQRDHESVAAPGAHEVLRPGDVLALLGDAASIDSARRLLRGEVESAPEDSYAFFGIA